MSATLSLTVRRVIDAPPERLFEAWTTASRLQSWWGPPGVRCTHAEVDARTGGRFRIANELPDGRMVWIAGQFRAVDPARRLEFTWKLDPGGADAELVSVRFEQQGGQTEVTVTHDGILDETGRTGHEQGWAGCLEGLASYVRDATRRTA